MELKNEKSEKAAVPIVICLILRRGCGCFMFWERSRLSKTDGDLALTELWDSMWKAEVEVIYSGYAQQKERTELDGTYPQFGWKREYIISGWVTRIYGFGGVDAEYIDIAQTRCWMLRMRC